MSDFSRTLQTADDATRISRLLVRAAEQVRGYPDRQALTSLAKRYADYAQALRETASPEPTAEPAPDQEVLI